MAYSTRASLGTQGHQDLKQRNIGDGESNYIEQEDLRQLKNEIDMLQDIEGNKCTLSYCIKEEEESGQDLNMFDIAMDMSHILTKSYLSKVIRGLNKS